MLFFILASVLVNLVAVQGRTEVELFASAPNNNSGLNVYAYALGRAHYNPWTCNYREEPGYTCLSCTAALHCFPANFALLVQCAGLFPYCRNGYCSRWKTDGCNEDYMFAEGTHGPLRITTTSSSTVMAEANATETSAMVPDESASTTVPTTESNDSTNVEEVETLAQTVDNVETDIKPNTEKDPRRLF